MLTIRQFVDFLLLLKSGNALDGRGKPIKRKELWQIYEEIAEIRSPARLEWLDAEFSYSRATTIFHGDGKEEILGEDGFYIAYHQIQSDGTLREAREHFEYNTLLMNCYIDLSTANKHGLPTRKSESREIYYRCPGRGFHYVARFDAGSDGAILSCYGGATYSDAELGVRRAKIKP